MRRTYAPNSIVLGFLFALATWASTDNAVLGGIVFVASSVVLWILIRFIENAIDKGVDKAVDAASAAIQRKKAEKQGLPVEQTPGNGEYDPIAQYKLAQQQREQGTSGDNQVQQTVNYINGNQYDQPMQVNVTRTKDPASGKGFLSVIIILVALVGAFASYYISKGYKSHINGNNDKIVNYEQSHAVGEQIDDYTYSSYYVSNIAENKMLVVFAITAIAAIVAYLLTAVFRRRFALLAYIVTVVGTNAYMLLNYNSIFVEDHFIKSKILLMFAGIFAAALLQLICVFVSKTPLMIAMLLISLVAAVGASVGMTDALIDIYLNEAIIMATILGSGFLIFLTDIYEKKLKA